MKGEPQYVEGQEAWTRFEGNMRKVLSVSKEELARREAAYRQQADASSSKRGSKPGVLNHKPRKPKPSA